MLMKHVPQIRKLCPVSTRTVMGCAWGVVLALLSSGVFPRMAMATEYRLGVGDLVKIVVYEHDDLTMEDRITDSGALSFPYLGEVTVGGLTKGEAENRITTLLSAGKFIKNPQVSVRILQYREPKVSVLGLVNRPGRYPVEPLKTVLDALADAGGLSPLAEDQVVVLRREGDKTTKYQINLHTTIDNGNLSDLLTIQNGDIISVAKAKQFYVYGAVQRSGVYRLERDMTVIQGLAVAGGLSPRGTDRGLIVRRLNTTSNTVVEIPVSFKDTMYADDVLVVKESLF